jgi:hypothetical protein
VQILLSDLCRERERGAPVVPTCAPEYGRDLERRCCLSTVSACERSEVEIVIDGSCLGNPGPGGWACILRYGEHERVLQGGVPDATNNRMELAAAIEGLRALKRTCQVTILTDSDYVRRGITEFLPRWKNNGWQLYRFRYSLHYAAGRTMPPHDRKCLTRQVLC